MYTTDMDNPATRGDLKEAVAFVREDIAVIRKQMDDGRADIRDTMNRHADEDTRRFDEVHEGLRKMGEVQAGWSTAIAIAKWGVPIIVTLLGAHVYIHWPGAPH